MYKRSAGQSVRQGIIGVDASREQSQWPADSWNIGKVLLYNDRDTMMIDKTLGDYTGEQMVNGNFHACSSARMSHIAE